jgi:hypothetical protein
MASTTSARPDERLLRLHPNPDVASALHASGFCSALEIAHHAPEHFVATMADDLGGADTAQDVHDRARQIRSAVMHVWANVNTAVRSPQFNSLLVSNAAPEIAEAFEDLPSYQELFGSLDYVECSRSRRPCRSSSSTRSRSRACGPASRRRSA